MPGERPRWGEMPTEDVTAVLELLPVWARFLIALVIVMGFAAPRFLDALYPYVELFWRGRR